MFLLFVLFSPRDLGEFLWKLFEEMEKPGLVMDRGGIRGSHWIEAFTYWLCSEERQLQCLQNGMQKGNKKD